MSFTIGIYCEAVTPPPVHEQVAKWIANEGWWGVNSNIINKYIILTSDNRAKLGNPRITLTNRAFPLIL